jgi:type I restriction enzyme, S subunit
VKGVVVSEVADINPKAAATLRPDDLIAFVGMADLDPVSGRARDSERRPYSEVARGYTAFRSGDLLLAKITPCFENMKIGQAETSTPFAVGSTEFHVLRPREGRLDARYLLHFLRQQSVLTAGRARMTGSGGQRRVPAQFLADLRLPLPPIEEQRRIAAVLDAADALRAKRRQALAKLDTLTQAIFLDMFGDPRSGSSYPRRSLGEISVKFSDGPFGSNLKSVHYISNGVRVIRLQNIGAGKFVDDDRAFVSADHFSALRKHECRPGDILIGTLGDPNLRACIQPPWLEQALNKADCVQMRVDPSLATPEWACALLNFPGTEALAHSLVKGQTRARISMGRLRDLEVPVPPIDDQLRFASAASGVRRGVDLQQVASARMDALFLALQQRAFSGEL